jgi:hypothetical protein
VREESALKTFFSHDLKVPQVHPMLYHVEHGGTPAGHSTPSREGVSLRSTSAVAV